MRDNFLLLGGPICGAVALLLFAIPVMRPRVLTKYVGSVAALMVVPMSVGYACHSWNVMLVVWFTRLLTSLAGGGLAFGFVILSRDRKMPPIQFLPLVPIVIGAAIDLYSIYVLTPLLGGA